MPFERDSGPAVMRVSYIAPTIMYVAIAPNYQECWVLLHWISGTSLQVTFPQCACLFYCLPTSSPGIIATGSADIFTIAHVWLCGTGPAYMPETKQLFCNSFTRLAGMLQYPCFKRCFEPTDMFVAVAPDHLARRLQLNSTSMHAC